MSSAANLNGNGIRPVPGLDDVVRDPRCAAGLPKAALIALLLRAAAAQSSLTAQLAAIGETEQPTATRPEKDNMLTTAEAAKMLRRAPSWLYRHAADLPFVVKRESPRSPLLCSEQGIRRYLARR